MEKTIFTERFNQHKLNTILQNKEHFKKVLEKKRGKTYDDYYLFDILEKYLENSDNGLLNVEYINKSGREFAVGSKSLQSMMVEIRHTITDNRYMDIDISNCHPVIFMSLCERFNVEHDNFEDYINNRNKHLRIICDDNGIDRKTAKQIYLSILNGGVSDYKKLEKKPDFLKKFKREYENIHKIICEKYSKFKEYKKTRENEGIHYNHYGSFINKIFCIIENNMLTAMWEFLGKPKECILCFDGIMVVADDYKDDELLYNMENAIGEKTGIKVELEIKPMNNKLDLSEFELVEYDDSDFGKLEERTNKFMKPHELKKFKEDVVNYMNKEYFMINSTPTKIVWCKIDRDNDIFKSVYKNKESMKMFFSNQNLYIITNGDKRIKLNPFTLWLESRKRNTYEGITFDPIRYYNPRKEKYPDYNEYYGLKYEREHVKDVLPLEETASFFEHIKKRWCKNDLKLYKYVLDWFATIVQKPGYKMKSAIVLKGLERCGKGIIVQIIKDILGSNLFYHPSSANEIIGQFNSGVANKLFIFLDELSWGGNKEAEGVFKKFITESTIEINAKFEHPYTYNNCINVIIASNKDWVVPVGYTSTRWQVIEVSEELSYMSAVEKRPIIKSILDTPIDRLAKFFYERDITDFDYTDIIHTEALEEQKAFSMTLIQKWYVDIINTGFIGDKPINGRIYKKDIYNNYKKISNDRHKSDSQFWMELKKMDAIETYKSGKNIGAIKIYRSAGNPAKIEFKDIDILRESWLRIFTNWKFDDMNVTIDEFGDDIMEEVDSISDLI